MGHCIYCNWEGECYFFEKEAEHTFKDNGLAVDYGFNKDGYCVVEDDECPEASCNNYETDDQDEEE